MNGDSRTLKTTETSLQIIELLADLGEAGVTQLANELDLPTSTVHGHLATLYDQEFVVKNDDMYRLGLKFLGLGKEVKSSNEVYQRADSYTKKVATKMNCHSIFAVEEHGWGTFVSRNSGDSTAWEHEMAGKRFYLHVSAAGKSILAHLPEKKVDQIIASRGLPKLTDNTVTTRDALMTELETVRERGVAFNREEEVIGVKAVGAPVTDHSDNIVGALSANGPAEQLVDERFEEKIPSKLKGIANEFELDLELSEERDLR